MKKPFVFQENLLKNLNIFSKKLSFKKLGIQELSIRLLPLVFSLASIGHLCASLSVMKIQKKIKCRQILKSTISNHNGSSSHLPVQHTTIIVTYLAKNIISSSRRVLHHEKQNLTVGRSYLLKTSFSLEWHFPARNLGKMRFRSFTFNSGRGLVYI